MSAEPPLAACGIGEDPPSEVSSLPARGEAGGRGGAAGKAPVKRRARGSAQVRARLRRIMLGVPLLVMAVGCERSPGEGTDRKSGLPSSSGKYYCVSFGGRKLCFEEEDVYWPVVDSDDPRGLAALMPAFEFHDPECSQPASTVENVRQFLITESRKNESMQRRAKVDYEHYEPYLTTKITDKAAGMECWNIREKSPVPDRGLLCIGQTNPSAYTLITCNGDDVPVPHCNHRTYLDGLSTHMHYPRQCFPHWKKLESIPLAIIRDAEAMARKLGK